MSEKFKVEVNSNYTFHVSKDELENLDIVEAQNNSYHLIHNNESISAKISDSDFTSKYYEVTLQNKLFKVNVFNSLDILIEDMGFSLLDGKDIDTIHAPMPGLVLDILVKEGQEVSENQPLLILEAMKMENVISSPRNGKIKSIQVSKSSSVNKNDLLIEFE
ncbi:MAG: acetyl-CoA carboxylase biotin carboxyl carrier protein subunit [Flavobacteriaceae bacterium]|nr:acetyl-CoA carboxylase biotin carboxyl carrier protein subunit [Flavobacteriaceae bacterium]